MQIEREDLEVLHEVNEEIQDVNGDQNQDPPHQPEQQQNL